MYGFGEELTKENLLSKVSSYDIFKHYSENFIEVGKLFNSDFREDNNPSCCIAQIRGDLMYTDFGTRETYRCIDFVMARLGLNFVGALQQINSDFHLGLGYTIDFKPDRTARPEILKVRPKFKEKQYTVIKKKKKEFTKKDLEYWNSFYWTEWMLNEAKTQSISHYWINDNMWRIKTNELAFSYEYYWHNKRMQRKLYFPERDNFKWVSNVDNTIVQLVDVAPKMGDILFITSSKKDAGIFWRMRLDKMFPELIIHGVAPNNEGAFVPSDWFYKMQNRWKKIIIFYNNDSTGIKNAQKYGELYNLQYFYTPIDTPKDPSDFSKKYGLKEFFKLIKSKIYGL